MKKNYTATEIINKSVDLYIRSKSYIVALIIVIFAFMALGKFLWATESHGIGIRTDSVAYLWSAENLVKGIGLGRLDGAGNFRPYTHWPPLYPLLLAVPRLMSFDGLESARFIGALCITFLILVTGFAISRFTDNSPWYVAGALLILINAPNLWDTSLYAMTEPLYMVLGLSTLLLFDKYLKNSKYNLLIFASLLMGLALATRYVGFSLIGACGLLLLIQKNWTWKRKIRDDLLMGTLALIPFAIWAIRNILVAGTTTNRTLALIPIMPIELQQTANAMLEWFDPVLKMTPIYWLKPSLFIVVTFLAGAIYFKFVPPQIKSVNNSLWQLLLVYAVSYSAFTIMARLFFDQYIPLFEPRIQYPLFTSVFLLAIYALYLIQEKTRRTGWILPTVLACLYVFGAWSYARGYIQISAGGVLLSGHNDGLGIIRNANNPLLSVLAQYPLQENRFFTDNIEKLYFLSSLYSYQISSSQTEQINRITSELNNRGIVLVLFDKRSLGPEFQAQIPELELIYKGTADVYAAPGR